jgi:hypothetical protein
MSACRALGRLAAASLSADRNDQNQTLENIRQSSCRRHSRAVCLIISNFSNWNLFVIWVLLFGAYSYLDILTNSINKYFATIG